MPAIEFVVPGVPVPKGRPRLGKNAVYTPAKTKLYERAVGYYAREAMKDVQIATGAVSVEMRFYMPIPTSYSGVKRLKALSGELRHVNKPDCDNILKAVLDSCNNIVYVDDNQVCDIAASKFYGEIPHATIKVSWE